MSDLLRLLTLEDYNTRVVALGCGLLGAACGGIGTFTLLRGRALVADVVAHASLPGVCAAFLIFGTRSLPVLLLGALVFGILGMLCVTWIRRATPVKEDAALAITLSVFFGIGICLLMVVQQDQRGTQSGVDSFIFGKAAAMVRSDVILAASMCAAAFLVLAAMWNPLKLVCFDRSFGDAIGLRMGIVDFILMALVCLCTTAALPAVGLVMVVALLTIPPAAARFWTDRLTTMVIVSSIVGAVAGVLGAGVSALHSEFSTGPVIVLICAAIFGVSMLFAPRRGVLFAALRRVQLRTRVADQNLLRSMYELSETNQVDTTLSRAAEPAAETTFDALLMRRAWTQSELEHLIRRAISRNEVERSNDRYRLTQKGRTQAAAIVRAHRLWELFLIDQASIAPDHVDRDADSIEHVLPEDVIAKLEQQLRETGKLPTEFTVPKSPHEIHAARP